MSKNKYVEIATRKVISSYGGVGSIYETTKGAVMIEPFDLWDFIHFGIEKYIKENDHKSLDEHTINDDRLLSRLSSQFKQLSRLIRVPDNVSNNNYSSDPEDKQKVIQARYFPEWFYCNGCNSFKHISHWYRDWQSALANISRDEVTESFQEPKCARCYLKLRNQSKKVGSKLHFSQSLCLEQVRFIMTAPNGKIKDLPWERWNTAQKGGKDEDGGKIALDFDNLCCDKQELEYIKSNTFEDYAGIRVKCRSCKKENLLAGLFGLKLRVMKGEEVFYKPVLRSSNSVYYPIIFNSIFIPIAKEEELTAEQKNQIAVLNNLSFTPEEIADRINVDISIVKASLGIGAEIERELETEEQYRLKEYNYILSENQSTYANFISEKMVAETLSQYGIKSLTKIKRLKMTSVQTGYTRQEPYDRDEFLRDGSTAKVMYTSRWANEARYLPAVESYGEGVLIELDKTAIEQWYEANKDVITNRVNRLKKNALGSENIISKAELSEFHSAKYLLIHTLSHILIKELEFLCGYPATSICERLYDDESDMQGVLIYTIAGTEGSYGGLVSQGNVGRFEKLLQSALTRACDCASDPVCYNSESQGIGGQNLAACYSCALLPENSCENFNSYLDRAVLIDSEFGFFKMTPKC